MGSVISPSQLIWICPACRISARIPSTTPRIFCVCGYTQENGPTPGLGDYVAAGLHMIGVTPQLVANAKAAVGLKRRCGCRKRQRVLNQIGRALGVGR